MSPVIISSLVACCLWFCTSAMGFCIGPLQKNPSWAFCRRVRCFWPVAPVFRRVGSLLFAANCGGIGPFLAVIRRKLGVLALGVPFSASQRAENRDLYDVSTTTAARPEIIKGTTCHAPQGRRRRRNPAKRAGRASARRVSPRQARAPGMTAGGSAKRVPPSPRRPEVSRVDDRKSAPGASDRSGHNRYVQRLAAPCGHRIIGADYAMSGIPNPKGGDALVAAHSGRLEKGRGAGV